MITDFIDDYQDQNEDLVTQHIDIRFDIEKVSNTDLYFPYCIIVDFENMTGEKLKDFESFSFLNNGRFETSICVGEKRAVSNFYRFIDEYKDYVKEAYATVYGDTVADEFDLLFPDTYNNKNIEIKRRKAEDSENLYTNSDKKVVNNIHDVPKILKTAYDVLSGLDMDNIIVEGLEDCLVPYLFSWKERDNNSDIRVTIHPENNSLFYGEVTYKNIRDSIKKSIDFEVRKEYSLKRIKDIIKSFE